MERTQERRVSDHEIEVGVTGVELEGIGMHQTGTVTQMSPSEVQRHRIEVDAHEFERP
jgi:hypothetical protein